MADLRNPFGDEGSRNEGRERLEDLLENLGSRHQQNQQNGGPKINLTKILGEGIPTGGRESIFKGEGTKR